MSISTENKARIMTLCQQHFGQKEPIALAQSMFLHMIPDDIKANICLESGTFQQCPGAATCTFLPKIDEEEELS